MKLAQLSHPDDDPPLVREACFYVGWQLRSPDSWEYKNILTGEESEVELDKLIEAVKQKHEAIQVAKNNQNSDRITTNAQSARTKAAYGNTAKSVS